MSKYLLKLYPVAPAQLSRSLRMFEIDGTEKEDVAKYLEKKIPDIIRMLKENKKQ